MPLKNDWQNGDLFTSAAANDMANAVNNYTQSINLRDYITNPSDTSTHAAGFQSAVNAASTAKAPLFVPGGTWYVQGVTIPQTGVTIRGAGKSIVGTDAGGNGTRLVRTTDSPIFTATGSVGTGTPVQENWLNKVRDFHLQDISLQNSASASTTPMLSFTGATGFTFINVTVASFNPVSPAPLMTFQSLWDSHFVNCNFFGGGSSAGVGAVRILGRNSAATYESSYELRFVNCNFTEYIGPGLEIGSNHSDAQLAGMLLFSNIKMESKQATGPHIKVVNGFNVCFDNTYITHEKTTGPIADFLKGYGFYGELGFAQVKGTGWTYPSCLVNVASGVSFINLDVNAYQGYDSTTNMVTQSSLTDPQIEIRINGTSNLVNATNTTSLWNPVSTVFQNVTADTFNCQYIFSKVGRNSWGLGNPTNPASTLEQFNLFGIDPVSTNQATYMYLRSYAQDPTASSRVVGLNSSMLLENATQGFITYAAQSSNPSPIAAGISAFAKDNGAGRTQLSVYDGSAASLVETRGIATTASSSSLTINSDTTNHQTVSALAAALTINAPTGSPTSGQELIIAIKDNGTARALTWNAAFVAIGTDALPATTTISKWLIVRAVWSASASAWHVIGLLKESETKEPAITAGTSTQVLRGNKTFSAITSNDIGNAYTPSNYISGNYYYATGSQTPSTAVLANNLVRVSPWVVTDTITITRLFCEFTVAGEANSVFRIGIWNHDATTARPGTLVIDAGTISTGTGNAGSVSTGGTPGVYEITVSQSISPGFYWIGGAVQGATTTAPTMRIVSNTANNFSPIGTSLPGAGTSQAGAVFTQSGAFTTASSMTNSGLAGARIGFKVS